MTPALRARLSSLRLCLIAFGVSLPVHQAMAQEMTKTLTIEADEWCPINCEANGNPRGIGIDLAKKVFEPLGYRINYVVVPWTQALKDVRAGLADAAVGANSTDDPKLIFPQEAITHISDDFYVLKGNPWRYQGEYSLKDKRLGVIADYGYTDVIKKYVDAHKAERGTVTFATGNEALKNNINNLLAGRIDVFVDSRIVVEYWIQKLNLNDKLQIAGSIPQDRVYLAFSPANAASRALAKQYDDGVRKLRQTGELDKLYKAYGVQQ